MAKAIYHVANGPEPIDVCVRRVAKMLRERCTCKERDPELPLLVGHEAECSLQSTGWLS